MAAMAFQGNLKNHLGNRKNPDSRAPYVFVGLVQFLDGLLHAFPPGETSKKI